MTRKKIQTSSVTMKISCTMEASERRASRAPPPMLLRVVRYYGDSRKPDSEEIEMQTCAEKTVFQCAITGDTERLQSLLDNESDHSDSDLLSETDEVGRNALFAACMLGRSTIVEELVKKGADVNAVTARGYSPLHIAAIWDHEDTLKTLVELNANLQVVNFLGERAIDAASRYSKLDCVEYLAWAEAKQSLQSYIAQIKDILADPERIQGKLNKVDKSLCVNTCLAKTDWIQNVQNPAIQDFTDQRKCLEDVLGPILAKLTDQSE